jgi:hypothetical protein
MLPVQGYMPALVLRFLLPNGGSAYASMDAYTATAIRAVMLASGYTQQVRPGPRTYRCMVHLYVCWVGWGRGAGSVTAGRLPVTLCVRHGVQTRRMDQ